MSSSFSNSSSSSEGVALGSDDEENFDEPDRMFSRSVRLTLIEVRVPIDNSCIGKVSSLLPFSPNS